MLYLTPEEMKLIKVKIPKGVLYLTPEEWKRGLQRGKRIVRAEELRKRIKKLKEAHARQPLAWYAKELREAQEEEMKLKGEDSQ